MVEHTHTLLLTAVERVWQRWGALALAVLRLGKPRIALMATASGVIAVLAHPAALLTMRDTIVVFVTLFVLGHGTNALNQIAEVAIDARMHRTRSQRPLPSGMLTKRMAICIAGMTLTTAMLLLWSLGSWLALAMGLITTISYVPVYTLWTKPKTVWSPVLGVLPGAMGPLVASAAVYGGIVPVAWAVCALIVLWTPSHVWALQIAYLDDFTRADLPAMPRRYGMIMTKRWRLTADLVLVAASLLMPVLLPEAFGIWYASFALVLGGRVLQSDIRDLYSSEPVDDMQRFRLTILHLSGLLLALLVDASTHNPVV